MPTLVAALTLVALLKMQHLAFPRWHLAIWFAALVTLALNGSVPRGDLALNGAGSFAASWLYFLALQRTDNIPDRALHWLILIGGFVLLLGSRLWLDLRHYAIGL